MVAITDSDGWVPVTRPEITDIALGGNETNFPGKYFRELASRDQYLYETALGGDATAIASSVAFRQLGIAAVAQGRLTLETGVPVSTTDQTAKTVLYYTPYSGDYVALYDTVETRWDLFQFTERSLSLSGLAANTNYDIFIWDNSGTLTLQAVAWASSGAGTSTRASAITQLNGVWVKDSDKRRYLGTIRTTGTIGQCEDSALKRLVCNASNVVNKPAFLLDTSWNTYTVDTWRYYDDDSQNQILVVNCFDVSVLLNASAHLNGNETEIGVGLNSLTPPLNNLVSQINASDYTRAGNASTLAATSSQTWGSGYNEIRLVQRGGTSNSIFYEFFGASVGFLFPC